MKKFGRFRIQDWLLTCDEQDIWIENSVCSSRWFVWPLGIATKFNVVVHIKIDFLSGWWQFSCQTLLQIMAVSIFPITTSKGERENSKYLWHQCDYYFSWKCSQPTYQNQRRTHLYFNWQVVSVTVLFS